MLWGWSRTSQKTEERVGELAPRQGGEGAREIEVALNDHFLDLNLFTNLYSEL